MATNEPVSRRRTTVDYLVEKVSGGLEIYSRFTLATKLAVWSLVAIFLAAIFAPVITPYDFAAQDYNAIRQAPSVAHPFGTDNLGRDVLTRIVHGARTSLGVSFGVVLMAVSIGVPIGSIAGYRGGWVDETLMRLMDAALSFPSFVIALAIVGILGPNLVNVVIVIGIVYAPQHARLIRSSVLSVKEELYVEAAMDTGLSDRKVLVSHILPNAITPVVVQGTFHAAEAILLEAALSFLGLGVQPPTPTWGVMIANGRQFLPGSWWLVTFPGTAIIIIVLSLNLIGDRLRDEFDPHSTTEEVGD